MTILMARRQDRHVVAVCENKNFVLVIEINNLW